MAARHYYFAYERTDGEVCYLPNSCTRASSVTPTPSVTTT